MLSEDVVAEFEIASGLIPGLMVTIEVAAFSGSYGHGPVHPPEWRVAGWERADGKARKVRAWRVDAWLAARVENELDRIVENEIERMQEKNAMWY